jgi:hypothetical protein
MRIKDLLEISDDHAGVLESWKIERWFLIVNGIS